MALLSLTFTLVFCPFVSADSDISWHTFLGSSSTDEGYSVVADASGNLYVTGYSSASWGAPINAPAGNSDAFVAKFYDLDFDDDGWPNDADGCPYGPNKSAPGACGCGVADTDTDGDGTADCLDQFALEEIISTSSSGIRYWDVAASEWTKMTASTTTGDIAAGDFTGDGKAEVASCWSSGLWYQDGATFDWTKVSNTTPTQLTSGDVTDQ